METSNDPRLEKALAAVRAVVDAYEFQDHHILLANRLLVEPKPAEGSIIEPEMLSRLAQLLSVMCMQIIMGEPCSICALGEAMESWPKAEVINMNKLMEVDEGAVRPYSSQDVMNISGASLALGILSYQVFKDEDLLHRVVAAFMIAMGATVHHQSSPHLN